MKNQYEKHRDIRRALSLINRFVTTPALTKWERTAARQAAKYLTTLIEGARTQRTVRHGNHLTPAEVAQRFKVQTVTVRQWAARGRLESICTPGGHRRFPIASVERFAREYRC